MTGMWAMFLRELSERRAFLVAAVVAALIPVVVPALPGLYVSSAADIRGAFAWGLALLLGWVMAVIVGSSMIAGDLTNGRASFLFSQPVDAVAIWFAKVFGNLLILVAVELVVLLPAMLLPGRGTYFDFSEDPWWSLPLLVVGVPLFLMLAAHALGVVFRARSAWIVLDAASTLIVIFAAWSLFWSWAPVAPKVAIVGLAVLCSALLLFMFAAGWAQVVTGRTDLRQGHRALSVTLSVGMLVTLVALAGVSAWLARVPPDGLAEIRMVTAGGGNEWIAVGGTSSRCSMHQPTFLYNVVDGRWRSIATTAALGGGDIEFSDDGRTAVWLASAGPDAFQLMSADLGGSELLVRELGLVFRDWIRFTVSADGSRVAVVEAGTLSVIDLRAGKLLAAVRLDQSGFVARMAFNGPDVVRLVVMLRGATNIKEVGLFEFDLASKRLATVFKHDRLGGWNFPHWAPDLGRCLIADDAGPKLRVWRLFTAGGVPEGVPVGRFHQLSRVAFLRDERIAMADVEDGRARVIVVDPAVGSERSYDLGAATEGLMVGLEVVPGELVVATRRDVEGGSPVEGFRAHVLDLESGVLDPIPGAGLPLGSLYSTTGEVASKPLLARLFYGDERNLILWDPDSGTTSVVLSGAS